jgi:S-phase kinase-associated protein 1
MKIVKLQSSDGELFSIELETAKMSMTIRTMLEDLGNEEEDEVVPLLNVNAFILRKVIYWCSHHAEDPAAHEEEDKNEKSSDLSEIRPWDAEFLKVDQATLFDLILAANYLDIKGLLEVACKSVANMIKNNSPEQIRKNFNIINENTPDEFEQEYNENEGSEEK